LDFFWLNKGFCFAFRVSPQYTLQSFFFIKKYNKKPLKNLFIFHLFLLILFLFRLLKKSSIYEQERCLGFSGFICCFYLKTNGKKTKLFDHYESTVFVKQNRENQILEKPVKYHRFFYTSAAKIFLCFMANKLGSIYLFIYLLLHSQSKLWLKIILKKKLF
jgi:hypothetical protein